MDIKAAGTISTGTVEQTMKSIVYLLMLVAAVRTLEPAESCKEDECSLADNCACSNNVLPVETADIPQLVLLTFEDACTNNLYENYYTPLLFDRKNSDGNYISATFFVPHEYTDYHCVNQLYNRGFEIGVHSITKNYMIDYWRNAEVDTLVAEFGGQKQIIEKFANIPGAAIQGVRAPQLQLSGDNSIIAYQLSDLTYDSSWPSRSSQKLFQYTLDYYSSQDRTSTNTPESSFPGFWISPVNNLVGNNTIECNTLLGCNYNEFKTAQDVRKWLVGQFEETYLGDRTPFKLLVNSAWFNTSPANIDGFQLFLDYLVELSDVFLVTESQALEWRKNPVPTSNFDSLSPRKNAKCNPVSCQLPFGPKDERWMVSCVKCPATYPWLNNPEGK